MCRLPGSGGTWMGAGGGMGTVTQQLAKLVQRHGRELRTRAKVASIRTDRGVVKSMVLESGEELSAPPSS